MFNTELTFDRVTIYDGHNAKQSPVLGIYRSVGGGLVDCLTRMQNANTISKYYEIYC